MDRTLTNVLSPVRRLYQKKLAISVCASSLIANGFTRYFKGNIGGGAAMLDVHSEYGVHGESSVILSVRNAGSQKATVTVLDAYSGEKTVRVLGPGGHTEGQLSCGRFGGWYDFVVTVAEDPGFQYRLAGHVETGRDSISDPAMGGLVTLQV
jgi:phospholipase C